jgi:hypothetical protein
MEVQESSQQLKQAQIDISKLCKEKRELRKQLAEKTVKIIIKSRRECKLAQTTTQGSTKHDHSAK